MRALFQFTFAFAVIACSLCAHATAFTYRETTTGTGSLNGLTFTNQSIVFTGLTPTNAALLGDYGYFYENLSRLTVTIGSDAARITDNLDVIANQSQKAGGFAGSNFGLGTRAAIFRTYNLRSDIDATGTPLFNSAPLHTDAGIFQLDSVSSSITFEANSVAPGTTPEPSAVTLLGTGLLGMTVTSFRRIRRR